MRPKLLRDFGWKVTFVLAKGWYEDRAAVLKSRWSGCWLGRRNQRKVMKWRNDNDW